ncbi:MAG: hypothetical protein MJ135_05870 [Oscillospiraceae bacterium]|nr:hypothetical protein [Oscillospiraceae bacterium]
MRNSQRVPAAIAAFLLCFCLFLGLAAPTEAMAIGPIESTVLSKVTVTTSNEAVVYTNVSGITAAVTSSGCRVSGLTFYDASGAVATGTFRNEQYTLKISVEVYGGYVFSPDVYAYLNNKQVSIMVDPSMTTAVITTVIGPSLWAPTVYTQPTDMKVELGGKVTFLSSGAYYKKMTWEFVSPDGKETVNYADAKTKFSGLSMTEDGAEAISLIQVPAEMNGWKIRCAFEGAKTVYSKAAKITVTGIPAPEATPMPTPEPTPEPETDQEEILSEDFLPELPAEETAAEPEEEPAEEHEHSFEGWLFSETGHWQECSCGERSAEEAHRISWTVVKEATRNDGGKEEGMCEICGYRTERETEALSPEEPDAPAQFPVLPIILGVLLLLTVLIVVQQVREAKRRKRRRRRAANHRR